jgi:LmbE family N-acetylglucosaminyl deacetylase
MQCNPPIQTVGTLLGVWAHPDDEAYLSSGLMALARRHGQRVVVLTATDGEAGETRHGPGRPGRVAALRRRELAASLAAVGVHEHHRLGLRDGGCDRVPARRGAALVGAVIDAVQPDTIVTFGPDGMTGHPDHQAVSAWVTEAWSERQSARRSAHSSAGGRGRLWYATLTAGFHRQWGELNREMSIFPPGTTPPSTLEDELAFEIRLDGDILEQKVRALRSHASQVEPLFAAVGAETFAQWWAQEAFVDAARVIGAAGQVARAEAAV